MESRKTGDFEFKLGKFGLVLFTLAVSLLLLFSFIFGVIVGKNIESYPEKIVRGIPNIIKKKITRGKEPVPEIKEQKKAAQRPGEEKKKDEFKLTFYDTLTDKTKTEKIKTEKAKTGAVEKYIYTIQVASFREREKTEALASRLKKMKLSPTIDKIKLASRGTWFRVKLEGFPSYDAAKKKSKFVESKIRGLKCLIIKNKK